MQAPLLNQPDDQAESLARLGLENFESVGDCMLRQSQMLRRLDNAGLVNAANIVRGCSFHACRNSRCVEGCHFATRKRRFDNITSGYDLFMALALPVMQVTIVHPMWAMEVGNLQALSIGAMRQWVGRRLESLGQPVLAIGIAEVSLNVELTTRTYWAGEVQMLAAGIECEPLKRAFAIEDRYRDVRNAKPVKVQEVDSGGKALGAYLGYATKRFVEQRIAYIGKKNDRVQRRHLPLVTQRMVEHDAWLLSLPINARTIAFGCVRRGSRFFPREA